MIMSPDTDRARWWLLALIVLSGMRTWLAWWLPLTGDEAYFYFWGLYPAGGFYDHPPMVGWWLAGLNLLSDHPLVLRLPALLVPVVLAWLLRLWLLRQPWCDQWCANGVAMLLILAPLNVWNVAITTDVPLMFFAGLATLAYLQAHRLAQARNAAADSNIWYILAGLALGAALMSKYFAGLLALGFAAHLLFGRVRRRWVPLALLVMFSVPAAIWQGLWNAEQCWPNLMFNLVNRHGNAGLGWRNTALYITSVLYVMGPVLAAMAIFRSRAKTVVVSNEAGQTQEALAWIAGVPLVLFLALSLIKPIGLHWLAAFVLPGVMGLAMAIEQRPGSSVSSGSGTARRRLGTAIGLSALFGALHWGLIVGAASAPLNTWQHTRLYPGLVMTLAPQAMRQALAPYLDPQVATHVEQRPSPIQDWLPASPQQWVLASDGYSPAVTMSMGLGRRVVVFGPGSSHARHDDILTDWRLAQGRNILIIRRDAARQSDDAKYFERVQFKSIEIEGARFELTLGEGFRYEPYRDGVLDAVRQRYYAVPQWLARWSTAPCYFCARYFPQLACHR